MKYILFNSDIWRTSNASQNNGFQYYLQFLLLLFGSVSLFVSISHFRAQFQIITHMSFSFPCYLFFSMNFPDFFPSALMMWWWVPNQCILTGRLNWILSFHQHMFPSVVYKLKRTEPFPISRCNQFNEVLFYWFLFHLWRHWAT